MNLRHYPFKVMGSPCQLQLYAEMEQGQRVADAVIAELQRLEQKYSRYRDDSVTSHINRSAGGAAIEVDAETAALLDYAAACFVQSDGLFDISSGVLHRAWDFQRGQLPDPERLAQTLALVGWSRVHWQRPWLRLPQAGMELDFGGFVKEYAADVAANLARQLGVQHGLVELGGDIAAIGPHPDGRPWAVGIRHPRQPQHAMASLSLLQGGLASSGDYERFMEIDGRRYCHILNPQTGWPAEGLRSVSVVAEQCLIAGSATTIAMLKGKAGVPWLEQLGLPYLAMTADAELLGTTVAGDTD